MSEFSKPETEPEHVTKFRGYIERQWGITDPVEQDQAIELFDACLLVTARRRGIIPMGDPIEAMRQKLIMEGITDPDQQRAILQRYYLEIEDPRPRRE